jgi:hypothetical protein
VKLTYVFASVGLVAAMSFVAPADATVVNGNIAAYRESDNTLLGYVGTSLTVFNTYPITNSTATALNAEIDTTATAPFSLFATNPSDPSNPYVGAVPGNQGSNFVPGSAAYAFIADVPLGSSSNNPIGSSGESAIWTFGADNVLSAEWTGGNTVSLTTFHNISFGDLELTGDLDAFQSFFGDSAEAVTLVFTGDIPIGPTPTPEPATLPLLGTAMVSTFVFRARRRSR